MNLDKGIKENVNNSDINKKNLLIVIIQRKTTQEKNIVQFLLKSLIMQRYLPD